MYRNKKRILRENKLRSCNHRRKQGVRNGWYQNFKRGKNFELERVDKVTVGK